MGTKKTHTKKGLKPPKKHSQRHHAHVYWPYIPLILLLIGASFINIWQPLQRSSNNGATLAYATSMSRSALLSNTNSQRSSNGGIAALTLNSQLNAAAQAKANDMIARDYWSHDTPDGQKPWVFIDAQGYSYQKAGENLAYGFATSADTITGWMNSPSHRDNMLDSAYTEVGFGFADSANFVGNGENTVVVAMYALPTNSTPPAPEPEPEPEPVQTQEVQQSTVTTPTPVEEEQPEEPEATEEEVAEEEPIEQEEVADTSQDTPVTTDDPESTAKESTQITLFQQLTEGNVPVWTVTALSLTGLGLSVIWLMKHAMAVKRLVIEGEHFVAHHPVLDLIVVSIIAAIIYLSQTSGVIL